MADNVLFQYHPMLPFRKILYPVDYSSPCRALVPYVRETRERFSAELLLVHAYGPEALAYSRLPITDPDLPVEAREHEQQRLRDFAAESFPGEQVDTFVDVGEAGTVIHDAIQHQGADLVMVSTHGRGPIRRLLLGSVTAKVLHDSSAAVWTGRGSSFLAHSPRIPYKSVLCAIDHSEEDDAVLKAAAAMASVYGAELSIVHAVEPTTPVMDLDLTPYAEQAKASADARLRDMKAELGIDAPHTILEGHIPDVIREQALSRNADLLVVGRGLAQTRVSRVWSHLYQIVRESPCPVLSI